MLPYGRQAIDDDDIQAVVDALKGDYLTTGPAVKAFEQKLCDVTGAKYAVACSNGTTALHLACMALNLKEGECAVVPTLTFLATANAVRYCGTDVVFCDVDPETGLMTADTLLEALSYAQSKGWVVKAVLPVHLAGQAVDLADIRDITSQHNIKIIADACHAIGGTYQQTSIGACEFEDMSAFSFHPVKTIAMGEGGAVTTNNEKFAETMRTLRHHGMSKTDDMEPWAYEMQDLGYNYRVTDIQCALGTSQLNKIDTFIEKRESLVALYNEKLADLSEYVKIPHRVQTGKTGWHLYAIRVDFEQLAIARAKLMDALKERGVGTQVHYIPVHTQPYYTNLYGARDLPGAQTYYEKTLSLPLYPLMTEDDVSYVVKTLKDVLGE
jgi:UDP-4-amino-4,6-dideoxy-N-acetyl-beta-L-altrosamine transaminase|tara:strand:+ start:220480 stop:221625 length:1146 start_codon:yes stop_codon:yes gene_type:complete